MASHRQESTVSLEQLPMCWNDRRLLKHEPFCSLFMIRQEWGFPSTTTRNWPVYVKTLIKDKEFSKAFIRWCLIAFEPLLGESPTTVPGAEDFVKEPMYWELFVDVFYALYSKDRKDEERRALTLLNNERRKLGFDYVLSMHATECHVFSKEERGLLACPSSSCEALEFEPAPCSASQSVSVAHADVEASGKQSRSPISPKERIFGSVDEIEAASKTFMKAVPKGGDDSFSQYSQLRQKSSRKAVPSRSCLADFSRKDRESEEETKTLRAQARQKMPNKKTKVKKSRLKNNTRTFSEVIDAEVGALSGKNTLNPIASQVHIDAEEIAVNNPSASLCAPCGPPTLETTLSAQHQDAGLLSHAICEMPQNFSAHKTRKRKLPANSAQNMSPEKIPSEKRRKLPGSGEGQESIKEHVPPKPASATGEQCTSNRRRKRMEGTKISQMRGRGSSNNLRYDPSVRSPRSSISMARPSSTSSDETLVDKIINESDNKAKGLGDYDKFSDNIETAYVEGNAVEDQIRLEKMATSYEMSRPYYCQPKPALPKGRRPLIWAGSRQALCETTTWFRCYHGGVYFNDGKAHGYLLGGYSSQRDVFHHDGKLIISHGGGKSLEGSEGQRDQDVSVRSLLNNYKNRCPLVLIADDKYAPFPFDLGERMYVILGSYWIVDAWAEKDVSMTEGKLGTRIKYKFAFQYCEGQGSPWWLDRSSNVSCNALNGTGTASRMDVVLEQSSEMSLNDEESSKMLKRNVYPSLSDSSAMEHAHVTDSTDNVMTIFCTRCSKSSPRIYKQGWMCLHPNCASFFRINSQEVFLLDYEEQFLELRPHPDFGRIDLSLPSPLGIPETSADSIYTTKGWWCPECGQLCPRERWECWACSACNISFTDVAPLPIRDRKEFWAQELGLKRYTVHRIYQGSGITLSTRKWSAPGSSDSGLHYIFELPDNRGRIHLISGNTLVNSRANDLFRQYQEEARDKPFLRRYPLRCHHARGRMLANYFSHNAGAPYKYAVSTNSTVPFDQAPKSVNSALRLIKDRVSLVLNNDANFNEILTAAYMMEQKMSYHTDDEKGLGPIVASLSLGSLAFMHFRQHKTSTEYHPGKQLTLILRHGDVLAMEGAAIQKLYDHTVVPMNFRIAATARYIDSNL